MIRDARKINIETNFFSDEADNQQKFQEETLQSALQSKQKGAIALFNILDTIRLRRTINTFNTINSVQIRHYNIYEQKVEEYEQRNRKKVRKNENKQKQKKKQQNYIFNQQYHNLMKQKYITKYFQQKRSKSISCNFIKQNLFLRQSRKRILNGINKRLLDQSQNKYKQLNKNKSKDNLNSNKKSPQNQKQQFHHKRQPSKQNVQISLRLQKLQNLIKNIRRQKQKQIPVKIYQKKIIKLLPKKQKNHSQMKLFLQEISSLRKQVQQVKVLNQTILRRSRQRSATNSRSPKSQHHIKTQMKVYQFASTIKKSQLIQQKHSKSMQSNKSQKLYKITLNEPHLQKKNQQPQQQLITPKKQPIYKIQKQQNNQQSQKITQQISTSKSIKKQRPKPKSIHISKSDNKTQIMEGTQNSLGQDRQKYSPISKITRFVNKQLTASSKQRLKRQPSLTQSEDQLYSNQFMLGSQKYVQGSAESGYKNMTKSKQKSTTLRKIDFEQAPISLEQPDLQNSNKQTPNNYDTYQIQHETKQLHLNLMNIQSKQQTIPNGIQNIQRQYKQKQWYKKYADTKYTNQQTPNKSNIQNRYKNYINSNYTNDQQINYSNNKYYNENISKQNLFNFNSQQKILQSNNLQKSNNKINDDDEHNKSIKNNNNQDKFHNDSHVTSAYQSSYDNQSYIYKLITKNNSSGDVSSYNQSNNKTKNKQQQIQQQTKPTPLKQLSLIPYPSSKSLYQPPADNNLPVIIYNNPIINPISIPTHQISPLRQQSRQNRHETCQTVSDYDNGSCNSYTYSKGSSAFTNFNKLQLQSNAIVNNQDPIIQDNFDKISAEEIVQGYQNVRNYCSVINAEHCQTSKAHKQKDTRNPQNMYQSSNSSSINNNIPQKKQQMSWQKKLKANINNNELQKITQLTLNMNQNLSNTNETVNQYKNIHANYSKIN